MVSFWDKKSKPVLLLDSFHETLSYPVQSHRLDFYNKKKSGVDVADKRIRGLTCKWPYSIFSNMVDVAVNNACILYK